MKHDLKKEVPSRELLGRLIDERGVEAVLNPRSPAYKDLNLGEKKLSKAQAIDLIQKDPNLMRRPLVLSKGKAVLGYAPAEYEKL